MKPKVRLLSLVVVLTALLGSVLSHGVLAQDEEDPITRIDNMLTDLTEQDEFSGSVLVARGDEILLSEGYGLAVREQDVPNAPNTIFRIGSVTQQFTAMAIMLLQERGLLSVEDPICMYFEECPETWESITIHHLLTHTSGIIDLSRLPYSIQDMTMRTTPEEIIAWFIQEPLDFVPGEQWSFSNSGYIVLGYILEEVSGNSYQTFLRENLLEPLGMEDTDYDNDTHAIERRAYGYDGINMSANFRVFDMSHAFATGGLYSTVEDLFLWNQALYGGQVISDESWEAMMESRISIPDAGEGIYYGYGLFIEESLEHPAIGHADRHFGFRSLMTHFTDDNVTVIILSNNERVAFGELVESIAEILFDD